LKSVQAFITNNAVSPQNKLRLLILFALRYQKTQASNIASLITLALQNGVRPEDARLVYAILNIAGADHRQDDLYSTESLLALGRSALKGLKVGYTTAIVRYVSHVPVLRVWKMCICNTRHTCLKRWRIFSEEN
jgi:hypothetical protein